MAQVVLAIRTVVVDAVNAGGVTDAITSDAFHRDAAPSVMQLLKDPIYLDYARYAKHKGKIVMQS